MREAGGEQKRGGRRVERKRERRRGRRRETKVGLGRNEYQDENMRN